jgi:hypothetical protein
MSFITMSLQHNDDARTVGFVTYDAKLSGYVQERLPELDVPWLATCT